MSQRFNAEFASISACAGLLLGLWLAMLAPSVGAATYVNAATTFSWIDAGTHTKVGYNTTPYKFNNTGGCGTTPPTLDDTLSDNIPLGFTFNYGGTNFTSVRIMSNGRLQFNNNTTCGYGSPVTQLPYPAAGLNYSLRIYGNDLDPTAKSEVPSYSTACLNRTNCYVSYATLGTSPSRKFVVTWYHVPEWTAASTASGSYDLQVILQENGEFVYQFGNDTPGPGNINAQVGWQISTTDYAVPNVGFPTINSAIRFYIPSPISELRMDEGSWSGSGSVVNSSGGTNGTPIGSAQSVAGGKLCRGGNIPANNSAATIDAIDTGYDVDSGIGSSGTIDFWYKSNGSWGSQNSQLFDATVVNNRWFYLTQQNGNGRLSFNLTDAANNNLQVTTGNNSIAAATWTHIAVTWNLTPVPANNRLRIYINGALAQSAAISTIQPLSSAIGTLYMGDNRSSYTTNPGTGNSANGVIDEVRIYNYEATAAIIQRDYNADRTCPTLDHVRLDHTGNGVTCTGSTVTVKTCNGSDSSGSCTANTDGLTGNVLAMSSGGATLATVPFSIASGSSSATVTVPVTTAQTATFTTSGLSVAPVNATTCWNGTSASCSHIYSDSGFIFDVPHHVSEVLQTVNVSAVKKSDSSLACTPAFASVSKNVTFKCGYTNPATGTLPVRVNGTPLNVANSATAACDSGGRAVSLAFGATGVAGTTFQYADVGNVSLTATYTGSGADAGLSMTGSDSFIAAPKDFAFSGITAGPIKAGKDFSATITARNDAENAVPNFGQEASAEKVTLTFAKYQPTGVGAVNGNFSGTVGSFVNGVAGSTNLNWDEVGKIDLTATLTSGNYLGNSGLTATGTTGVAGAVGRFIPDHFDVAVTQGCSTGGFTYSGQPFTVTVTAKNGLLTPTTTLNYDGSSNTSPNFSRAVTLSDANSVAGGGLSPTSVAAGMFAAGVASVTPAFTFTAPLTAPATIKLHAAEDTGGDGVVSSATEGTANIRSGRLRLFNAFGSEKTSLRIPVQAQYWGGNSWILNADDTCTDIPATSVVLSNYRDSKGAGASWTTTASGPGTLSGGQGQVVLAAPNSTGSVDLALNLGTTTTDNSCLATHPAMATPPAVSLAYLRSRNGTCAASNTFSADPSATAGFGIYSPETRKAVHVRELF